MILERLIHILIPLFYPIRLAVIPLENTQMRLILKRFFFYLKTRITSTYSKRVLPYVIN